MDPSSLPRERASTIAQHLNDRFSQTSGYLVEHMNFTSTRTATPTDTVVVLIKDRSGTAQEHLVLDGWADAIQSLDNGDAAALEAFILLLHANLDELWSAAGHRT